MDTNNNSKDLGDLESLVKMYKEGFLTEEEFKKAKAKILGDSDTKEETENVTEDLEKGKPESSDNSQENAATESSKAETPLDADLSEKTTSEKNINTEISDKETNKTASSNTEVKKKKNYKKLYWGIGIVAVVALSVCAYLAYLYPTQNELLCFFNQGDKCYAAGLDYQEGTDTIKKDENKEKQLSYYQKSCELNYALGCEREAELGDNGLRLDKNYKNSIELYTKACKLDKKAAINSCVKLANVYFGGVFVKIDTFKSRDLFEESCTNGSGESCYLATYFYYSFEAKEKNPKFYDYLKKSCDYEYGPGCISLYEYFYEKNPNSDSKFINEIKNKGINICKSKCNDNDAENCYELGINYLRGQIGKSKKYEISPKRIREINTGIDLLFKACNLGSGNACYTIGTEFEEGFHVNKDIETANTFYRFACEYGDLGGCNKINFKPPWITQ